MPPPVAAPTDADRIAALEAKVEELTRKFTPLAGAVAAMLAQQMQPQMQQAILARLTGQGGDAPAVNLPF